MSHQEEEAALQQISSSNKRSHDEMTEPSSSTDVKQEMSTSTSGALTTNSTPTTPITLPAAAAAASSTSTSTSGSQAPALAASITASASTPATTINPSSRKWEPMAWVAGCPLVLRLRAIMAEKSITSADMDKFMDGGPGRTEAVFAGQVRPTERELRFLDAGLGSPLPLLKLVLWRE